MYNKWENQIYWLHTAETIQIVNLGKQRIVSPLLLDKSI
jgi:hypothetical protein